MGKTPYLTMEEGVVPYVRSSLYVTAKMTALKSAMENAMICAQPDVCVVA